MTTTGIAVCLGWFLDLALLRQLHPSLASMKLNTALALALLGGSLWLSVSTPRRKRAARGLAVAGGAIAGVTLFQDVAGVDLGLDELLVQDPAPSRAPGRMSPATASCLVLLAAALLWIDARRSEWLALCAALAADLALLGYLYGVRHLYAIGPYSSVALHTALAVFALALGIVLARPERKLVRLLSSDTGGGLLARRLLPAALVLPAALALLRQWGEQAGLYGTGFGRAMLVAAHTVAFVSLVWWAAAAVVRSTEQRRRAEASGHLTRAELERSHDRLRVLAAASHQLAAVATSYRELLRELARSVADLVGDGCIITLLSEDGVLLRAAGIAHADPQCEAAFRASLGQTVLVKETSQTISARVARSGVPIHADVDPAALAAQSDPELRAALATLPIYSLAVVPIRARQTILGTLSIVRSTPDRGYSAEDVTMLQDLADRAGLAIENARLYRDLERRVAARTAELEVLNEELEAFNYTVAHDLRAPVRRIAGFSRALLEDCEDGLPPEGARYASLIERSARKMGQLIDDLLAFSRASHAEIHRERVDVSALAHAVVDRLHEGHPDRAVEVVIAPDLSADADPRLLEVVLGNLVGNAWKFTEKRAGGRIEVGARAGAPGAPAVYFVRDNGAGFDPAQVGKLFGVFQRLHAASEFEGTGIGLATAERIVQRHGGRIWAEGAVGEGATFSFTLEAPPHSSGSSPAVKLDAAASDAAAAASSG